jgi:hypothetical protein
MPQQLRNQNRMSKLFEMFDANEASDSLLSISEEDDYINNNKKANNARSNTAYHSSNFSVDSSVTESEQDGDMLFVEERNIKDVPTTSTDNVHVERKSRTMDDKTENDIRRRQFSDALTNLQKKSNREIMRTMQLQQKKQQQESVIDIPEGETFRLPHDNPYGYNTDNHSTGSNSNSSSDENSSSEDYMYGDTSNNNNTDSNGNDKDDDDKSDVVHEHDDPATAFVKRNRQRNKLLTEIASRESTAVRIWRTIAYSAMISAGVFLVVGSILYTSRHNNDVRTESVRICCYFQPLKPMPSFILFSSYYFCSSLILSYFVLSLFLTLIFIHCINGHKTKVSISCT